MIFIGNFCYAQDIYQMDTNVNTRGQGIGFKYGTIIDYTSFGGKLNEKDKSGSVESKDDFIYIRANHDNSDMNNEIEPKLSPLETFFIQSSENALSDFRSYIWLYDYTRLHGKDIPPVLKEKKYSDLINSGTYDVPYEDTYAGDFADTFPQYSDKINQSSNPSLSADYDLTKISISLVGYLFLPYQAPMLGLGHRVFTLGLGFGVGYTNGYYRVNVCDPFSISTEIKNSSRKRFCLNKNELFSARVSYLSFEGNAVLKLYSYIGDSFELNIFEGEGFAQLSESISNRITIGSHEETVLTPNLAYFRVNPFSIVFRF